MNAEQAWQSVLGQLQMEMPRASFDTWSRPETRCSATSMVTGCESVKVICKTAVKSGGALLVLQTRK